MILDPASSASPTQRHKATILLQSRMVSRALKQLTPDSFLVRAVPITPLSISTPKDGQPSTPKVSPVKPRQSKVNLHRYTF